MEVIQTRLVLCIVSALMTTGYSKSTDQRIQQHINKTSLVGDTVILYCNYSKLSNEDITWKRNNIVIFSYNSFNNQTMTNFSSNRMYINSLVPMELKINQIQASDAGNYTCFSTKTAIRWVLTLTGGTEKPPESRNHILLCIIRSCIGLIMICLIISLSIWFHRKRKNNEIQVTGKQGKTFHRHQPEEDDVEEEQSDERIKRKL